MRNTDLDVAAPEHTEQILRNAADQYRESAAELSSAWTDPSAGKVWNDFAAILERAASSCERARIKRGV